MARDATADSLGTLSFDPGGADFTPWVNRFKDEVYHHWEVPEAARGAIRHAEIQFTVERNGSLSALHLLRSTGSSELDRAAWAAIKHSSFARLPRTYKSPRITMRVSFYYNESPK